MRQLVADPLEDRLPDQLSDELLLGFVGKLAVRVQRPAGRKVADEHIGQLAQLETRHGRYRHDLSPVTKRGHGRQPTGDLFP